MTTSDSDGDLTELSDEDKEKLKKWGITGGAVFGGLFLVYFLLGPFVAFLWFILKWGLMGLGVYGAYRLGKDYFEESLEDKSQSLPTSESNERLEHDQSVAEIEADLEDDLSDRSLERELEELRMKADDD